VTGVLEQSRWRRIFWSEARRVVGRKRELVLVADSQ